MRKRHAAAAVVVIVVSRPPAFCVCLSGAFKFAEYDVGFSEIAVALFTHWRIDVVRSSIVSSNVCISCSQTDGLARTVL